MVLASPDLIPDWRKREVDPNLETGDPYHTPQTLHPYTPSPLTSKQGNATLGLPWLQNDLNLILYLQKNLGLAVLALSLPPLSPVT
jgi:hypothetical protein